MVVFTSFVGRKETTIRITDTGGQRGRVISSPYTEFDPVSLGVRGLGSFTSYYPRTELDLDILGQSPEKDLGDAPCMKEREPHDSTDQPSDHTHQ